MHSCPAIDRRRFLALGGAGLLAAAATPLLPDRAFAQQSAPGGPAFRSDPFTLGVASGDPLPDGVVLWTRLAPDPLSPDGGLPAEAYGVRYEIAEDERFSRIVRRGAVEARPEMAHSVHVDVRRLQPGREYFYRFRVGPVISPVGRTRTAPDPRASVSSMALAFVSCQNRPQGYYTAYQDLVRQDLDLVLHLGDYIYEGPGGGPIPGRDVSQKLEIRTLDQYRVRHADYKSDPDLQAAHAAFPFVVTWDDHEVENNYADLESDPDTDPAEFALRRAQAYQAYYEHMPLRAAQQPVGPDLELFRRIGWGDLGDFHVLDTRQYRSDQPLCSSAECPEASAPGRTILGEEQERWLVSGLASSAARWNVLANQVPVRQAGELGGDKWGGYPEQRRRVFSSLVERGPRNTLVVTGDVHSNEVSDVLADFADPGSPVVATEFIGTSISSGASTSNPETVYGGFDDPWRKFRNVRDRGYVRLDFDRERCLATYRVVDSVLQPIAGARTLETFTVQDGIRGVQIGG